MTTQTIALLFCDEYLVLGVSAFRCPVMRLCRALRDAHDDA